MQAIIEGFINEDGVAIDATHFEARNEVPPKLEKLEAKSKQRGRKSKAERSQWLIEQAELEANQSLYEKKIENQLKIPLGELRSVIPQDPKWGVKKNNDGKNVFRYGYKAHLAVGTSSQYIFGLLLSSGSLNNGKAVIPLLKEIKNV